MICLHWLSLQWGSQWSLRFSASCGILLSSEEINQVTCPQAFWAQSWVWNPCCKPRKIPKWYFWASHQPAQRISNIQIGVSLLWLEDGLGSCMRACPVGPAASGYIQSALSTGGLCTIVPGAWLALPRAAPTWEEPSQQDAHHRHLYTPRTPTHWTHRVWEINVSLERHLNPSFRGEQATRENCSTNFHSGRSCRDDGVLQFQRHPCSTSLSWDMGYVNVHFLLRYLDSSTFRITVLTFRSLNRSQIIYQQSWLTREVSGDW